MNALFHPYELKGHRIKNRIVMAPMEFLVRQTRGGFVNDGHIHYYGLRAKGGVGLIIVEATSVHPKSMNAISQLGVWSDEHVPGLKQLTEEIHSLGAKTMLQLQHLGLRMKQDPIAPSPYELNGTHVREMTVQELHELQDAYVSAIRRAYQAGFDGIEFHGAHGYLLNQFSSPDMNRRKDQYGCSMENRMRFVTEVFERAKGLVDDHFIFGYRMGCNQHTIEDGIRMAQYLEQIGIDLLHISSCGYSKHRPELPPDYPYNWVIYGGSQIRLHVNIPVIVVYEIQTPQRANNIIEQGYGDFAAIGRDLIVDHEWANKALKNEEIRYCIRCKPCPIFTGEECVML